MVSKTGLCNYSKTVTESSPLKTNQQPRKEMSQKGHDDLSRARLRLAIARLRDVVLARRYFGDSKVRHFMRDIKVRLEERFNKLEDVLADPGNTRKIMPSRTQGGSARSFGPWERQYLGKLWDVYMNNKLADMLQKMDIFIEKYMMKSKLAHCTEKKIKELLEDETKDTPAQQMTRDACPVYDTVVRGWKDAQHADFGAPWSCGFIFGQNSQ